MSEQKHYYTDEKNAQIVIALAAYTNIMLCGGIHVGRNIWQV